MTTDTVRIAITGASGMIGATLAKIALEEGHEVIAIVRPGSKRIGNLPRSERLTLVECNIGDYKKLHGRERCDVFFHLAWDKTSVAGRDDVHIQTKNIEYTMDATELAHSWGASAFIGAGSQAEYGRVNVKLNENVPVNPESGYGIAKYAAGKLSGIICKQLGMRFCWARILSVYGELDANHTMMMYLIRTLLDGKVPELTACEQTWDYIYADDAAGALLAIGLRGVNGKTYCIGSGNCRKMKEYVTKVRDMVNPNIQLGFGSKEYYPHQVMKLCADTYDLEKDTGFKPRFSFEEGISKIIYHIQNQNNS